MEVAEKVSPPAAPANTFDAKRIFMAAKTADGFDNFLTRVGLQNNNALSGGTYTFNLVTRQRSLLEAAYRGSWVVGKIVNSVAEDMTRAGVNISTTDTTDLKPLTRNISRLKVSQSLCFLIMWGRLYGGAIAVIQIKGQDLSTPLDVETVGKDQFQGVVVFDRWQLNPVLQDVIDSGPDMGLPSFYEIVNDPAQVQPTNPTPSGQLRVHHSRVIRYTGIDLPFFQAITEMMWGESTLEQLWDRLISFDEATLSSAGLIDRANLRTIGIEGLREIIAAGGQAQAGLEAMFEMMSRLQSNERLTLIDKNDEFTSTAYSFAGLSDLLLQFGQQLSGATGIPLVRLFGQSPAGLSATGESDMRMYYDNINAQQESKLRNGWEVLLKVLWRSTFGTAAPDDLEFKFAPLWQMSATDKATNGKMVTETVVGAFEAGLTTRAGALKDLRGTSAETGLFSNITDEEIAEAEAEPPPEPDLAPEADVDPSKVPVKNLDSKYLSSFQKIKRWLSGN